MKIVIINGMAESGKDTFASFCKQLYKNTFLIDSVEQIKSAAKWLGWGGQKREKDRRFLANLKRCVEEYNNSINKNICEKIEKISSEFESPIFFIHVREPHNINFFKWKYKENCVAILVKNPYVEDITSNPADANVYDFEYDYLIENDGSLEKLRSSAETFMKEILS